MTADQFPRRVYFALFCLSLWVLITALAIEFYNREAGFYLPRTDFRQDNNKWQPETGNGARDGLRGIVATVGLLQYPLATLLIAASILVSIKINDAYPRVLLVTFISLLCGTLALSLAVYRGYFTSLGW